MPAQGQEAAARPEPARPAEPWQPQLQLCLAAQAQGHLLPRICQGLLSFPSAFVAALQTSPPRELCPAPAALHAAAPTAAFCWQRGGRSQASCKPWGLTIIPAWVSPAAFWQLSGESLGPWADEEGLQLRDGSTTSGQSSFPTQPQSGHAAACAAALALATALQHPSGPHSQRPPRQKRTSHPAQKPHLSKAPAALLASEPMLQFPPAQVKKISQD